MAGYDQDVFGSKSSESQSYDSDVFTTSKNVPAQKPEPQYTQEALDAHRKAMFQRNEKPWLPKWLAPELLPNSKQDLKNLAGGMTQSMRGALNLASPGLGEKAFPVGGVDTNSGAYMGGTFADPAAIGLGIAAAPISLPVKGAGLLGGAKAIGLDAATGAGIGGILGGLSDSGTSEKGAAIGALANPLMRGILAGGNAIYDWGKRIAGGSEGQAKSFLDKVFEGKQGRKEAADLLEQIRPGGANAVNTSSMVAGLPTNQATPKIIALEDMARGREGTAANFKVIDEQNRIARTNPLELMKALDAPTPSAPKGFATDLRARTVAPAYDQAGKELVPVDPTILTILQGEQIAPMVTAMNKSMQQGQVNAIAGGKEYIPTSMSGKAAPITDFAVEGSVPVGSTPNTVSVEALHRLQEEIQKKINAMGAPAGGADALTLSQLKTSRKQLVDWLKNSSEKYKNASKMYENLSVNPNRAAIGEDLLGALNSPLDTERALMFASKLNKLDSASGFSNLSRLSPGQQKQAQDILQSLETQAAIKRLSMPQQALPKQYGVLESGATAAPQLWHQAYTVARKIIETGGKNIDKQAMNHIASLTIKPQEFSAFLREFTPDEQQTITRSTIEFLSKNMRPVQAAALSGLLNVQE